jgi:ABC-2 type transport system permease protein
MEIEVEKMNFKIKINKRNLRYGGIATAFTAIFIAVTVLINIVGTILADRFPLKIDLTNNSVFKLQSQSKKILSKLNQDVTLTVLLSGKSYVGIISSLAGQSLSGGDAAEKEIDQVIKQYPLNSSKVKVNYLDLKTNPQLSTEYPNDSLAEGSIIVKSKLRSRVLGLTDLINVDTSQTQQGGPATIPSQKAEDAITSAIFYITSANIDKVAFTSGHEEATVSGFQSLLKSNAYDVSSQDLATTKIDATTKYIAIIAPQKDFTDAEIKTLNDFLNNGEQFGKNVMIFFSSSAPSLLKLEEFAKSWGISVGAGMIYDSTNSLAQSTVYVAATLVDTTIYKDLIAQNAYAIVPASRPLDVTFTTKDTRTTSVLVQSQATAQLFISSATDPNKKPTDSDPKATYTLMAMCKNQRYDTNNKQLTSAVIVGGSAESLSDSIIGTSSYANAAAIIKAMNSLTGNTTSLDILPVTVTPNTFTPSSTQASLFFFLFVLLIPIAIFIFGIIVWSRRKKL